MFYSLTWTKSKHALLEDRSYDQSLTNGYASAEKPADVNVVALTIKWQKMFSYLLN